MGAAHILRKFCLSSQVCHQLAVITQTVASYLCPSTKWWAGLEERKPALHTGAVSTPELRSRVRKPKEACPAVSFPPRPGPSLYLPALPTQGTSRGKSSEETHSHARMPGPHGTSFLVSMHRYALHVLGHEVLTIVSVHGNKEIMVSTL